MEHYVDLGSRKTKAGRSERYGSYICTGCGTTVETRLDFIKRKSDSICKSCKVIERNISNTADHGHINSPTYRSWQSAKARCRNKNSTSYDYYGKKGIKFDPIWDDFKVFLKDMGTRPEDTTLDRIDNNGNYTPKNCRWATHSEQIMNQNKRSKCTTTFIGVCKRSTGSKKPFRSYLRIKGKTMELGMYSTALEAATVRQNYIKKYSLPNKLNDLTNGALFEIPYTEIRKVIG